MCVCVCTRCLHVLYVSYVCLVPSEAKRALEPLELELSSCEHQMSARVLWKSSHLSRPLPPMAVSHRYQDFLSPWLLGVVVLYVLLKPGLLS